MAVLYTQRKAGGTVPGHRVRGGEGGTLAHELAEARLKNYFFSVDFGKRKLTGFIKKLKGEELWQEEMLGHTETYLDYVKKTALGFQSAPYVAIEKQIDYGAYAKDGFGTADCILVHGSVLYVIDFKYGKGVPVSAEGNPSCPCTHSVHTKPTRSCTQSRRYSSPLYSQGLTASPNGGARWRSSWSSGSL